jgi:hypothetical protein
VATAATERLFDRTDSTVEAPVGRRRPTPCSCSTVFLQRPELCDGWEVAIFVAVEPEEAFGALERIPRAGSPEEIERRYRTRYLPGQLLYSKTRDRSTTPTSS